MKGRRVCGRGQRSSPARWEGCKACAGEGRGGGATRARVGLRCNAPAALCGVRARGGVPWCVRGDGITC